MVLLKLVGEHAGWNFAVSGPGITCETRYRMSSSSTSKTSVARAGIGPLLSSP